MALVSGQGANRKWLTNGSQFRRSVLTAVCLLPTAYCLLPTAAAAPAGTVSVDTTLLGERARSGESELGDLITDAIRSATGADIAFVAAGEIKEVSLGPGNLTAEQIADALT